MAQEEQPGDNHLPVFDPEGEANMSIWQYLGVALFAWASFDIWHGYTWLHRKVMRDDDPLLYWALIALWLSVAATCFM